MLVNTPMELVFLLLMAAISPLPAWAGMPFFRAFDAGSSTLVVLVAAFTRAPVLASLGLAVALSVGLGSLSHSRLWRWPHWAAGRFLGGASGCGQVPHASQRSMHVSRGASDS